MDAKDIRNIQEAYMEVYNNELSEGKIGFDDKLPSGKTPRRKMKNKASNLETDARIASGVADSPSWRASRAIRLGAKEQESSLKQRAKKIRQVEQGTQKEQVDIYDIILSHLLDEGYAETEEAAHKIMVNMSEDWRESIVEARKKVKIDTQKPIEYKIADIGPGKKEYNVKTSKGWKEEVEPDPFGRPGGKYGGVRKGGGYEKGYEAMKKKIKELEDKK